MTTRRRVVFRDDKEKLDFMNDVAREFATHPRIVELATALTRGRRPDDYASKVAEIHRFVRDGIRYQPDPDRREQLTSPLSVLDRGEDDCDGKAVLAVSLLRSLGLEASLHPLWAGPILKHVQYRVRWPGSDRAQGFPLRTAGGAIRGELTIRGVELGQNPYDTPRNPETGKFPLA